MDPSTSMPYSYRAEKPLCLPHPSGAQHLLSLGLEYEGAAACLAATKSINSKSYEESFVFPLLCAGVNSFAKQRSSPDDFLATSPDGAFKASLPAAKAPSNTLAGHAVRTPQRVPSRGSPPVHTPHKQSARKRNSFSGRLPAPRSLLTQESRHAVCFALP